MTQFSWNKIEFLGSCMMIERNVYVKNAEKVPRGDVYSLGLNGDKTAWNSCERLIWNWTMYIYTLAYLCDFINFDKWKAAIQGFLVVDFSRFRCNSPLLSVSKCREYLLLTQFKVFVVSKLLEASWSMFDVKVQYVTYIKYVLESKSVEIPSRQLKFLTNSDFSVNLLHP